ncbi:MAG: cytochrome c biogenesis CcdA family protein [Nitrospinota bacterium]
MEDVSLVVAFLGGIFSFVSPCVLPLVPGYISFISGVSLEEMDSGINRTQNIRKACLSSLSFGVGFTLVFLALGATASAAGKLLFSQMETLQIVAGAIIILFGIHVLRLFRIPWLYRERRFQVRNRPISLLGAVFVGMAFAFGWTPCLGPILAAILSYAGTQETVQRGTLLLGVYSLGLGVPFLLTAVGMNAFRPVLEGVKRHMRTLEVASGLLLIVLGVLILTDNLSSIAYWYYSFT